MKLAANQLAPPHSLLKCHSELPVWTATCMANWADKLTAAAVISTPGDMMPPTYYTFKGTIRFMVNLWISLGLKFKPEFSHIRPLNRRQTMCY